MKSWKAWLLVTVIFATGVLAGAFGMRSYMVRNLPAMLANTRESMEDRILEHLGREVSITEAQKQRILPIVRESLAKGEKLHEAFRPQFEAILHELDDRIAAELDTAQQVKFAEFRVRMEKFRREGPRPGGPMHFGPPPGPPPGSPQGPPLRP